MIRWLAAGLMLLWSLPAAADQIDVVLKFASVAAAKADPVVQRYTSIDEDGNVQFSGASVIPDIKVWRASQDVAGTDADGNPMVTHNYLPGFFVLVSLTSNQAQKVVDLENLSTVQFVVNRDKANSRQSDAIIKSTVNNTVLQDLRAEPLFAGADYAWGNWR